MTTYLDEVKATEAMRRRNRAGDSTFVVVDGPRDGEWTVMPATDAICGGFAYMWEHGWGLRHAN